jgi:hypothetical protein
MGDEVEELSRRREGEGRGRVRDADRAVETLQAGQRTGVVG